MDAYILVSGTTTITGVPDDATEANKREEKRNKGVIFENYALFIECTSEIKVPK